MRFSDKAFSVLNIITCILFIIFIPLHMWLGSRASSTIVFSTLALTFIILRCEGEIE